METSFSQFQEHLTRWSSEQLDALTPGAPWNASYEAAMDTLREITDDFSRVIGQVTQSLQTRRNYIVPINRLPPEVLSSIFVDVGDNGQDKLWIAETCNLWRKIALSYPFMWTSLDLGTITSPSMASVVFLRSHGYPLSVKCYEWDDLQFQCFILELPRVQELDVIWPRTLDHAFQGIRAPNLKSLAVHGTENIWSVYLSPSLFLSDHPALEQLSLFNCRMAFTPANFRGLRELSIRFNNFDTPMMHEDKDIVSVLESCPALERLSLQGVNLHSEHLYHRARRTLPVHLSHLVSMQLSLRPSDIHCIISGIDAPILQRCTLEIGGPQVSEWRGSLFTENFRSLALLARAEILVADEHASTISAFNTSADSTLVISTNAYFHPRFQHAGLTELVTYYPMSRLHTVRLRKPISSEVIAILRSVPSVQTLELEYMLGYSSRLGNTTIIHQLLLHAKDKESPLICANLHTLTLEHVYLSMHSVHELSELVVIWPNLKHLRLVWCKGDLPMNEIVDYLGSDALTVEYSSQCLNLYDGMDLETPSLIFL